jgi:tetratricopeptide (TPR) repeat protein
MKILNLKSEIYLSECRKKVSVFIILFIIILSIYSNTFHSSWHFDDEPNITGNPNLQLREFSWQNIKKTFYAHPSEPGNFYRPVACLSFALNYYFGKYNVVGYHIVNISIHFLAAIFLFLLLYHTLNLPLLKARYGTNSYLIALLSTILWAINPIQTQAITYIVQRMASMAGMLYIISMYLYLKGRTATKNPAKIILFLLCATSTILALGSKENAIMIPFSLFLYDFLLIQGISRENRKKHLKILLVAIIMTLSIGIIYFSFFDTTFFSFFELYEKRVFTLWERLLTQPRVIIFYISLIFYPVSTRLSIGHDIVVSQSFFDPPTTILCIILIIGMVIGAIYIAKKEPLISFSVLFFFLNHIPESTILPLEIVFEHRNYTPSMFFFVPITIGVVYAISYFSYKRSMQVIIALSMILVIIGQSHSTFMRNFTWKNEESLWIDCTDKYPEIYRCRHNLSKYYEAHNQNKKAIVEYKKALDLESIHRKDEKAMTYYNLGVIYLLSREFKKAKGYFSQAMEIDPCSPGAHNNQAIVLAATTNDYQEVGNELQKAITCNPASTHARSNLGILLVKSGRIDVGIMEIKKALETDPNNVVTILRLGYAYMKKGDLGSASIYFKEVISKKNRNIRAFLFLAEIYALSGHEQKALKSLSQFLAAVQDSDLILVLEDLFEEKSLLTINPNMDIIVPLLCKAHQQRESLLAKNRNFLLTKLKYKAQEKKGGCPRALPPHEN